PRLGKRRAECGRFGHLGICFAVAARGIRRIHQTYHQTGHADRCQTPALAAHVAISPVCESLAKRETLCRVGTGAETRNLRATAGKSGAARESDVIVGSDACAGRQEREAPMSGSRIDAMSAVALNIGGGLDGAAGPA